MLFVACVLLTLNFVTSQEVLVGDCPNIKAVQNFEASRYLGKWYENQKYFALFEVGGKCITADYALNNNGSIKVLNTQINNLSKSQSSITGQATFVGLPTEAKLSVIFPSLPVRLAAPHWVIGTDYDSYAVVWSCVQLGNVNLRYLWILTRAQIPANETLNNAYAVLDNNHISKEMLIKTNHDDCLLA